MTEVAAAKLGLDACKEGLCFICEREVYFVTLEEDLGSLKYEKEELMKLVNHVQSRYQELQSENPPKLVRYNLCAWVDRVARLDLGIVIQEAEEEIGNKRTAFFCPKNVCNCSAVGSKVTRKLEYVKELSKEGRTYADAVDAIPRTVTLHLQTGRVVPVDGLQQTDIGAVNTTTEPGQP